MTSFSKANGKDESYRPQFKPVGPKVVQRDQSQEKLRKPQPTENVEVSSTGNLWRGNP